MTTEQPPNEDTPGPEPKGDAPRAVAVQCPQCGARFRARAWHEGLQCPGCRSAQVMPLPVPGCDVDYILADRSQGTTSADVTFGTWAKWCGFITANQYNTAVHRQNSELQEGRGGRPIHEVMVSLDYLDEEKAEGLLRFLTVRRPSHHDEDFVRRLLARPGVDANAVAQVQQLQSAMAAKRNEVPPIAQLLVQKHVIPEGAALEVLHEQQKGGMGALHVALAASLPPPKEAVLDKLRSRAAESRYSLRSVALVVVLVLAAGLMWARRAGGPNVHVYAQCGACRRLVSVEYDAYEWPQKCPRCGRVAVRYSLICPAGHVFTRSSPFSREPCPQCGADRGRDITKEDVIEFERRREQLMTPRSAGRQRRRDISPDLNRDAPW